MISVVDDMISILYVNWMLVKFCSIILRIFSKVILKSGMFELSSYIIMVWLMIFSVNCFGGSLVLSVWVVIGCRVNLVSM